MTSSRTKASGFSSIAEARLVRDLALGRSLDEISDERGIRYGTVRAQLRSAMSKTDTRRQGELVALAHRHATLVPDGCAVIRLAVAPDFR
jgi:DNA-binding CsgD family transcriptional regulator